MDDIIDLSGTSKGSFYYYFNTKDELLNTLSMILDDNYEILKEKMDPDMNSYDKLLYLNYEAHSMIEEKINIDLLASLYSTQLVAQGHRSLLDQNRTYYKLISSVIDEGQKRGEILDEVSVSDLVRYYSMCERALVSDWCLNKGEYSLREYSKNVCRSCWNILKDKTIINTQNLPMAGSCSVDQCIFKAVLRPVPK